MTIQTPVETFYRVRIDYQDTGDADGQDKVENRAFQFALKETDVSIETGSSPACWPYVNLESDDRKAIERLAGKIERYINRRKDTELKL